MSKILARIANCQPEKEPRDVFECDVRRMLKRALTGRDRNALAAALSGLMGNRKITKAMLDSFTAESKCQPRLPLSLAKALCQLIDDPSLRRYLNNDEDLTLIQIGEHARANRKLLAQIATPKAKGRKEKR